MAFVCHVILQDHVIERSCGFVEEPFKISIILLSLVAKRTLVIKIYRFWFVT